MKKMVGREGFLDRLHRCLEHVMCKYEWSFQTWREVASYPWLPFWLRAMETVLISPPIRRPLNTERISL